MQDLEHQHGAVLALGFVGKHALLQRTDHMLQMEAEGQTDPVELESKRPRAGDITLDVVTKLGERKAVALRLKGLGRHCSDEANEHRREHIV